MFIARIYQHDVISYAFLCFPQHALHKWYDKAVDMRKYINWKNTTITYLK